MWARLLFSYTQNTKNIFQFESHAGFNEQTCSWTWPTAGIFFFCSSFQNLGPWPFPMFQIFPTESALLPLNTSLEEFRPRESIAFWQKTMHAHIIFFFIGPQRDRQTQEARKLLLSWSWQSKVALLKTLRFHWMKDVWGFLQTPFGCIKVLTCWRCFSVCCPLRVIIAS